MMYTTYVRMILFMAPKIGKSLSLAKSRS